MFRFKTILQKWKTQKSVLANCKNQFEQNAQKKCKNLFVRPHKKIHAFSNKENDDVAQKLFCEKHFLQVAESKNWYLLIVKSLLGIHCNAFSAWLLLGAQSTSNKLQKRILLPAQKLYCGKACGTQLFLLRNTQVFRKFSMEHNQHME